MSRPPATPSHARRRFRASQLLLAVAIVALLSPYTTSWGADEAHFTLLNKTRQYLHVVINNKPFLYVGPGAAIDYTITTTSDLLVDVAYSPGQGVKGEATKTVQVELKTTSTGSTTNDCSDHQDNTCTQTSSVSYSSVYVVTPARWDVTPSDFVPVAPEEVQP